MTKNDANPFLMLPLLCIAYINLKWGHFISFSHEGGVELIGVEIYLWGHEIREDFWDIIESLGFMGKKKSIPLFITICRFKAK